MLIICLLVSSHRPLRYLNRTPYNTELALANLSRTRVGDGNANVSSGLSRTSARSQPNFRFWHIASFCGVAEFGRYLGIADSGEPSADFCRRVFDCARPDPRAPALDQKDLVVHFGCTL